MVNVAVIGAGYWGPNLIRNFCQCNQAQLHAVCDLSPERLAYIQSNYSAIKTTNRYEDILKDDEIQAVALAMPVSTHYHLASECLSAGKHVLVEKPLAMSSEECLRLIEMADHRNLTLMVGHTFLYNSAVEKVKSYIELIETFS